MNEREARELFQGQNVRITDRERLWTRSTKTDFLCAIGANRYCYSSVPDLSATYQVTGIKLWGPSGRVYACLLSSAGQHYLCNVEGLSLENETSTEGEPTNMHITSNTVIVENKTLVLGQDIDLMTPDQLITAIQHVEKAIAGMEEVKTPSEFITGRIKDLQDSVAAIAALLDAKAAK